MEALKRCDKSPEVVCAVARLFERDRKTDKARKWYERAIALDPQLGDAWAYSYAFELRQDAIRTSRAGNDTAAGAGAGLAEDVLKRCITAAPTKGELWCAVKKRTENRHLDTAAILRKAVEEILQVTGGHNSDQAAGGEAEDTMATE